LFKNFGDRVSSFSTLPLKETQMWLEFKGDEDLDSGFVSCHV
jgi:hypothetical protein